MIKLNRLDPPIELTPEFVRIKTAVYKADKKVSVWNETWIKARLIAMSNNKCCYC